MTNFRLAGSAEIEFMKNMLFEGILLGSDDHPQTRAKGGRCFVAGALDASVEIEHGPLPASGVVGCDR